MSLSISLSRPKNYQSKYNLGKEIPNLENTITVCKHLIQQAKKAPKGVIRFNKKAYKQLDNQISKSFTNLGANMQDDMNEAWQEGGISDLADTNIGYGQFDRMREELLLKFGGQIKNRQSLLHEKMYCDENFPDVLWTFITKKSDAEGTLTVQQCKGLYKLLKNVKLKDSYLQQALNKFNYAFKEAIKTNRGIEWC